jgi:hypothetical protein
MAEALSSAGLINHSITLARDQRIVVTGLDDVHRFFRRPRCAP